MDCDHDNSNRFEAPDHEGWVRQWCTQCNQTLDWHPPR